MNEDDSNEVLVSKSDLTGFMDHTLEAFHSECLVVDVCSLRWRERKAPIALPWIPDTHCEPLRRHEAEQRIGRC